MTVVVGYKSSRKVLLFLMPVTALWLCGCASSTRSELTSESLQATLSVLAKKHDVCGVMVAVIKNRKLDAIHSATGCLPAPTLTHDSVFQAASLSKPMFAYAVLKLLAQGKLSLDTPVVDYLPQGYQHQHNPLTLARAELVADPRLRAITVRMALNHTSGLPNWAFGPLSFEATPGTKWEYSGEGYVLLQRAVETVTGTTLDHFMTTQTFGPLAMDHSDYVWNERNTQKLLPGTKANGSPRATPKWINPNAAFSLYTSAQDYGTFMVAVLNDGEIIKRITASPVTVDPALGLSWGLGWGIEHAREDTYIWQWGDNMGYCAFAIASVRTGDGFVMLTNSENGLKLAQPITQKILPDEHTLFRSPILGTNILVTLCNAVRLCM